MLQSLIEEQQQESLKKQLQVKMTDYLKTEAILYEKDEKGAISVFLSTGFWRVFLILAFF
jgi:hypothetical protein